MWVEMYISTLHVFLGVKISRKKQTGLNTLPAGDDIAPRPPARKAGFSSPQVSDLRSADTAMPLCYSMFPFLQSCRMIFLQQC
jgi:hypothetical protein